MKDKNNSFYVLINDFYIFDPFLVNILTIINLNSKFKIRNNVSKQDYNNTH